MLDAGYIKLNDLEDDFLLLTNASSAIPIYNVIEPVTPLLLSCQRKTLKLFFNDIGLLNSLLLETEIRESLLKNEKVMNYGAPYENVVAQELKSKDYALKYNSFYKDNSNKKYSIDFFLEENNKIIPIKVKSSDYKSHLSIDEFASKYHQYIIKNNYIF